MNKFIKKGLILLALILACYGTAVCANNNSDQCKNIQKFSSSVASNGLRVESAEKYCFSGFLFNKVNSPESGSFVLFISGVLSMIGIGWVKKKKS